MGYGGAGSTRFHAACGVSLPQKKSLASLRGRGLAPCHLLPVTTTRLVSIPRSHQGSRRQAYRGTRLSATRELDPSAPRASRPWSEQGLLLPPDCYLQQGIGGRAQNPSLDRTNTLSTYSIYCRQHCAIPPPSLPPHAFSACAVRRQLQYTTTSIANPAHLYH